MENNYKFTIALIYDFDGTLAAGNMQEYNFIPAIGKSNKEFWSEANDLAEEQDADQILTYMALMIREAKAKGISLRREAFQECGRDVKLYPGVDEWFDRINKYGAEHGVNIVHYINSSGNKEIIEGTKIAKEFKAIFASSFYYDNNGDALWPAAAVNYTNKTQFLFKINKGIFSVKDSIITNSSVPEEKKRVAFTNMVYFGDGETDVPCMKLIKQLGGTSIAVYEPGNEKKKESARKLIKQDRVNFVCPADYSQSSSLDTLVKAIINKLKADDNLRKLKKEFSKDIKSK
jgi:hypothetical protein